MPIVSMRLNKRRAQRNKTDMHCYVIHIPKCMFLKGHDKKKPQGLLLSFNQRFKFMAKLGTSEKILIIIKTNEDKLLNE